MIGAAGALIQELITGETTFARTCSVVCVPFVSQSVNLWVPPLVEPYPFPNR